MPKKSTRSRRKKIRADELRIHPVAQREIRPARLRAIEQNLDLDAIGVVHAVEYEINGRNAVWVIDGQHRVSGLMAHGFGEWMVDVYIHDDVDDDERACDLFLKLNDRSPVAPYDKFRNAVVAGREDALAVLSVIEKHGLRPTSTKMDGGVCCYATLLKSAFGPAAEAMDLAFDTAIASWGRIADAVEGNIIGGLTDVFVVHNGSVNKNSLRERLAKYPGGPSALVGAARGLRGFNGQSVRSCLAEVVVSLYNKGRRSGQLVAP